jgi:hypothetical protein
LFRFRKITNRKYTFLRRKYTASDAMLHSKKGNAKVYADLAASRHDQPPPQVADEEWDGEPDDSSPSWHSPCPN